VTRLRFGPGAVSELRDGDGEEGLIDLVFVLIFVLGGVVAFLYILFQ